MANAFVYGQLPWVLR